MNRSEGMRRIGALWRDRCGAVVVEAALLLPLMAIGAVAAIDVGRYLEATARADRMASGMADLVSRADVIRDRPVFDAQTRSTDTGAYFELARVMAEPENFAAGGVAIASVTGAVGFATVNWMRVSGDAATVAPDRLSDLPPLPAGMPFIVAEVFLPFQPLILDQTRLLGAIGFDRTVYRRAVFRPRSAALITLAPAT